MILVCLIQKIFMRMNIKKLFALILLLRNSSGQKCCNEVYISTGSDKSLTLGSDIDGKHIVFTWR